MPVSPTSMATAWSSCVKPGTPRARPSGRGRTERPRWPRRTSAVPGRNAAGHTDEHAPASLLRIEHPRAPARGRSSRRTNPIGWVPRALGRHPLPTHPGGVPQQPRVLLPAGHAPGRETDRHGSGCRGRWHVPAGHRRSGAHGDAQSDPHRIHAEAVAQTYRQHPASSSIATSCWTPRSCAWAVPSTTSCA